MEVVHLHTKERLRVKPGQLPAPSVINRFMRSSRDRRYTLMDPRLLAAALDAARRFGKRRIDVVSAFRSAEINGGLRAAGREVALRSRHIHGQALDLRIPGVATAKLCKHFRRQRLGGVGCYPELRFVHIDVGPIRSW